MVADKTPEAPLMPGHVDFQTGKRQKEPSDLGTSEVTSGCYSFLTSFCTFILDLRFETLRPPVFSSRLFPCSGEPG